MIINQLPFVSVIMSTYNRDYILHHAIESVLKQDYPHFELIIIDDGSTDRTKEVVDSFQSSRMRYYWKNNEGQASGLNMGLRLAEGEIVTFIDSDDRYKTNHIRYLTESLLENQLDLSIGSFEVIHNGPTPRVIDYFDSTKTITLDEVDVATGLICGRKDAILSAGGFQGELHDIDLFVRMKNLGFKTMKNPLKTYEYHYGSCPDSLIIQITEKMNVLH